MHFGPATNTSFYIYIYIIYFQIQMPHIFLNHRWGSQRQPVFRAAACRVAMIIRSVARHLTNGAELAPKRAAKVFAATAAATFFAAAGIFWNLVLVSHVSAQAHGDNEHENV